ncbi:MAG: hypothetical protein AB7E49_01080 [Campylobacterales bacterium]
MNSLTVSKICGVYGFEITKPIEFDNFRIVPRVFDFQQAQKLASDNNSFNLTAAIEAESIPDSLIVNLEAILSFIEHQKVVLTVPIENKRPDPFKQFNEVLVLGRRHARGGQVIMHDTFAEQSRKIFIEKALSRLQDEDFCRQTQFRSLFFKKVESFSQVYIEINYFLLFSGVEAYARTALGDQKSRAPEVLLTIFNHHGLKVTIDQIMPFVRLRNSLFHNNMHRLASDETTGRMLSRFSRLVTLLILKVADFDDGRIRWDGWMGRYWFK